MLNSILIGVAAVGGITLSIIWMKSATQKINPQQDRARKWNEQREKELYSKWCDGKCKECDADRCPFREV